MRIDTSDPGKAANVAARAAILFARVLGYMTENKIRESQGQALAYNDHCFNAAIDCCFPELSDSESSDI